MLDLHLLHSNAWHQAPAPTVAAVDLVEDVETIADGKNVLESDLPTNVDAVIKRCVEHARRVGDVEFW